MPESAPLKAQEQLPELQKQSLVDSHKEHSDALESKLSPDEAGRNKLRMDQKMQALLHEKFGQLKGYETFERFVSGTNVSDSEREAFYSYIQARINLDGAEEILTDIEFGDVTLPTNRETFALFANRFGLQTSQDRMKDDFKKAKQNYLNALPTLDNIQGIPQTTKLRGMIGNLNDLDGEELGDAIKAIERHLV